MTLWLKGNANGASIAQINRKNTFCLENTSGLYNKITLNLLPAIKNEIAIISQNFNKYQIEIIDSVYYLVTSHTIKK